MANHAPAEAHNAAEVNSGGYIENLRGTEAAPPR